MVLHPYQRVAQVQTQGIPEDLDVSRCATNTVQSVLCRVDTRGRGEGGCLAAAEMITSCAKVTQR